MGTMDGMNGDTDDAQDETDDEAELPGEPLRPVRGGGVWARVVAAARERPLVALAAATGIGYVLGRGLPRLGLVAVLGVGGAVGYAVMALRKRFDGDDEDEGDVDEDDGTADTSDDAHDISVSSAMPSADRPRRKPKTPNVVGGA